MAQFERYFILKKHAPLALGVFFEVSLTCPELQATGTVAEGLITLEDE